MSEQQTTMRGKNKVNFTQVSNGLLKDKRISWKAKGIMSYLLSLPEDWKFYMSELETHATDGVSSFRSGMKELKEFGYVERYPVKDEFTKKVLYWETVLNEDAYLDDSVKNPQVEKPQVEKPQVEFPQVENRTLQILSNTNTKNNNINNNIIPSSKNEEEEANMQKLFEHWNSKKVTVHKELKPIMKKSIKARLKNYSYEQISEAIDNYEKVYRSEEHFFDTKYTFVDILREKDVIQFMDESDPLNKFRDKKRNYAQNKQYNQNRFAQQQVVVTPQKVFDPSTLFD